MIKSHRVKSIHFFFFFLHSHSFCLALSRETLYVPCELYVVIFLSDGRGLLSGPCWALTEINGQICWQGWLMQLNQWVVHSRLSAGSLEFLKVSRVQTDHLSETLPSVTELWYLQRKKPPPDRYVLPTAGISRRRLFFRKNECIIFDLKPAPYTGLSSYVITDGWHWINLRVESTLASF